MSQCTENPLSEISPAGNIALLRNVGGWRAVNTQKSEKSRSLTLTKVRQRTPNNSLAWNVSPRYYYLFHIIFRILALSLLIPRTPLQIFTENNFFRRSRRILRAPLPDFTRSFLSRYFNVSKEKKKKFAHHRLPSSMRQFRNHARVVINCRVVSSAEKLPSGRPTKLVRSRERSTRKKNPKLRPADKKRIIYFILLRCSDAKNLYTETAIRL